MPKREDFKIVELAERRFKIGRFDALTGSYIAVKLVSKLSNVFMAITTGQVTDMNFAALAVAQQIADMSKIEFIELQLECLRVIKEIQNIDGKAEADLPVLASSGSFAVPGLNEDMITVLALVTHTVIFNLTPFFVGNALTSTIQTFKDLSLFDAKTSTSSPTGQ